MTVDHLNRRCLLAIASVSLLSVTVASCRLAASEAEVRPLGSGTEVGEILVIGDSILTWNAGANATIPEEMSRELDRTVMSRAVSGAYISHPEPEDADERNEIRQQYVKGEWDWVVMDGGVNDLNVECGCGDCGDVMDAMIGADGLSGDIPEFVRDLVAAGSQVMYVGYYDLPNDAEFGFNRCGDEVNILNARLEEMADAIANVWYVSAGDAVVADGIAAYDDDLIHPSVLGSARIGEHVARAIERIESELK
ncbi:MAG: SGNH/GDSL hydrolase family protein [Synechococcus sp.]